MSKKVVICDGLSIFMRHYCANPTMSKQGYHMGGFVGFLGTLRDLGTRFRPTEVIVVWEGGGSKKRRLLDKAYKNGRRPTKLNRFYEDDIPDSTDNRNYQIRKLVEVLRNLPVRQIYVPDCEGDDAVAHLARRRYTDCEECEVVIASSDRDFYQLINDRINIWSPGRRKMVDRDACLEEFHVSPENFCLSKSVVGDVGDNVTGVQGVGYKTLAKRFPFLASDDVLSLQDIFDACSEFTKRTPKMITNILASRDLIQKNLRLVSLDAGTLPANIVKRIDDAYCSEHTVGKANKISFYRLMTQEGLNSFDVDTLFFAVTPGISHA